MVEKTRKLFLKYPMDMVFSLAAHAAAFILKGPRPV
jgi:hypothetical protein